MATFLNKSRRKASHLFSKKGSSNRNENYKAASFLEMMRYASKLDYIILLVALTTSILTGIFIPFGSMVMAPINTAMIRAQNELDTKGVIDTARLQYEVLITVRNLIITSLCIFIAEYISKFSFYWLCERQTQRIRSHFLKSVLYKDAAWFDVNETGALTQKMASGIDRIKAGMSDKIGTIIHALVALVAGTCMALTVSWKMTLVMLAVSPILTILLCITSLALKRANKTEMSAYSKAGALANEVFAGIKTVISFNAQFFEIGRYRERLDEAMKLGIRKALITGLCSAAFALGINIIFGVGYYAGVLLVFSGEMQPGEVFACFWAVVIGAMRLGQAVPNLNAIISAKAAAGDLFAIIDAPTQLDCTPNGPGRCLKNVQGRIVVDDVHFAYPTRPSVPVLKGVSFTIEAGQKVAFVGHSGCGKSTLASMLLRFYSPSSGFVTVDDVPLEDLNPRWLRQTIGCVSQEPVLFAATVGENLRLGEDDIPQTTIEAACRTANALDFILALPNGFDTLLGEGGVQLSGGQKQRLAIARALVRNPRILILDEATSALDTESEAVVQQALDSAAIGRTTISIAHRLSTIRNADMILVYEGGCIVERGTHDDLIAAEGIYAGLVQAQQLAEQRKDDFEDDDDDTKDGQIKTVADVYSSQRRSQIGARLSKSMVNADGILEDFADEEEGAIEEKATDASLLAILRFARPEWKQLVFGALGATLTGFRFPIAAILITQLFLIMSLPDVEMAKPKLLLFLIECLVLAAISGVTSFSGGCLLATAGEKIARRFRLKTFENLMRQDGYYFDQSSHAVGKLTARLASDAYNVQNAIDQRLADVMQGVSSLLFALILAFSIGPNVTPFCLICSALLVATQLTLAHYLKYRGRQDVMVAEEASRIASESIENIRTVQALAKQDVLYNNFCRASVAPFRRAMIRGIFQTLSFAISMAFGTINFSVCYGLGMYLVVMGYTRPYVVNQVVEALHIAAIIILNSTNYVPEYIKGRISAGIMFQMMNEQPRIDGMANEGTRPEIKGDITFSNVKFSYPNRPLHSVLDGLTFVAGKGKTVALVGPSGCGKSTVIRLLQRFYNTTGGSVVLDGTDTKGINVLHSRRAMAVVGQEPTLFNLTIKQNIVYGMLDSEVSNDAVEKAARLANVHDFIVSLPEGYETRIGDKGTQLSGGQRQRLAIARAIVRNPRILLLDEATSALDTQSEKLVQQALEVASKGRTCVIIAHRLSTVQHADLIVVVRDGRVVELGDHQQLLTRKGVYYRMVQKQKLV